MSEVKKVDPIVVTDTRVGKEYTLEFCRASVRYAERDGFKIGEFADFPQTHIEDMWFYAFRMHHPNVNRDKANALLEELLGENGHLPAGLVNRLVELYNATLTSLLGNGEETEGDEGNSILKVRF